MNRGCCGPEMDKRPANAQVALEADADVQVLPCQVEEICKENEGDIAGGCTSASGVARSSDMVHVQSDRSARIRANLDAVKRQGRKRQLYMRGPPFLVVNTIFVLATLLMFSGLLLEGFEELFWSLELVIASGLYCLALVVLFMCLLPSDRRLIRRVSAVFPLNIMFASVAWIAFGCYLFNEGLSEECWLAHERAPCWYLIMFGADLIVCGAWCMAGSISWFWALRRRKSHMWHWLANTQKTAGKLLLVFFFAILPLVISAGALVLQGALSHKVLRALLANVACVLFLAGIMLDGRLLNKGRSWLLAQGEGVQAAAAVAELLAGRNTQNTLATARRHFRFVSADRLTYEDMCQSSPNPALSLLAESAELGGVDAFVSHSWHDDPGEKWEELQAWRERFKVKFDREPKLWIDKYCLDQTDIEESLVCLPVYLAGCRGLLLLCGETYLKRLWCVLEILVAIEMGIDQANIEVCLLRSFRTVTDSMEQFDPRMAECADVEDYWRLQEVIEAIDHARITDLVKSAMGI